MDNINDIENSLQKLKDMNYFFNDLSTDGLELWNDTKRVKLYGSNIEAYFPNMLKFSLNNINSSTELLNIIEAINIARHTFNKDIMMINYLISNNNWDPNYNIIINTWLNNYYQVKKYLIFFDDDEKNNLSIIINQVEQLIMNINEKTERTQVEEEILKSNNQIFEELEKNTNGNKEELGTQLILNDGHPSIIKDDNNMGYINIAVIMYIIANIGIIIAASIIRH